MPVAETALSNSLRGTFAVALPPVLTRLPAGVVFEGVVLAEPGLRPFPAPCAAANPDRFIIIVVVCS